MAQNVGMGYRSEIDSPEGMVQLIAANFLRHGYYWYVTGRVPTGKSAKTIDAKLIEKYGIDVSAWERTRRKKAGIANAKYVRFQDWFILLVTEGHHPIKQPEHQGGEKSQLRDCRRVPIKFRGYSISYRRGRITPKGNEAPKWHAHVRIDRSTYTNMKSHFVDIACHRTVDSLSRELKAIPFARYAPIRRQLLNLLRTINQARASQGFDAVPVEALKLRRVPVTVFATSSKNEE
ncbi:hypothetical protein [Rhodopirellula europaea]|uniref:hypothetical protein n=1 Tax=Rhodopirellula europaea TaxID=1263866 RepID=UPI0030EEBB32